MVHVIIIIIIISVPTDKILQSLVWQVIDQNDLPGQVIHQKAQEYLLFCELEQTHVDFDWIVDFNFNLASPSGQSSQSAWQSQLRQSHVPLIKSVIAEC